ARRNRSRQFGVDSGVPFTLLHETVLCSARELLAFRAHRLWLTCLPFALFQEAVERGASEGLAILVNRFACACFLRHCRDEPQGRNHSSKQDSFHGLSPVSEPAVYSKNCNDLVGGPWKRCHSSDIGLPSWSIQRSSIPSPCQPVLSGRNSPIVNREHWRG